MRHIDTTEARDMQTRGIPFINVLPADSFRDKHIAGSDNVPVDTMDFPSKVEQLVGRKDLPVVVYCANAQCDASSKAADQLEEAGFSDVIEYDDGVAGWEDADLPTATSGSAT